MLLQLLAKLEVTCWNYAISVSSPSRLALVNGFTGALKLIGTSLLCFLRDLFRERLVPPVRMELLVLW